MSMHASFVREQVSASAAEYARKNGIPFRRTHADFGSGVFLPNQDGMRHGNFHPASYRAIMGRSIWLKRLEKALTVSERLRRADDDRRLCELDSCCSSDALLMNIFCHPAVRRAPAVLGMLGIHESAVPIFGWRARVPLANAKSDRTEVDMKLGTLLVEAKLTESSFESCSIVQMKSYADFGQIFRLGGLPRFRKQYQCYQLLRNVLAAYAHKASFCLLTDARRVDMIEAWFGVLAAIRPVDLRVRCKLLTWQELATVLPRSLQNFLALKYGITADVAASHAAVGY